MARRTRIKIVSDSLLVLRERTSLRVWCQACGTEAEMIPLNEAGVVSNLSQVEVQAWMESEDLHHTKTADGIVLICLNSMRKRVRRTREGESAFARSPAATGELNKHKGEKP